MDSPETTLATHLNQEISKLKESQHNALKGAAYFQMTPDETTQYDERRAAIKRLVAQLAELSGPW